MASRAAARVGDGAPSTLVDSRKLAPCHKLTRCEHESPVHIIIIIIITAVIVQCACYRLNIKKAKAVSPILVTSAGVPEPSPILGN